uniref:Proline-rich protein PRCC n=1 Tax=Caenorhabditis tropicalis TaxID=1561998 RepID=A0A1I7TDP4_9PELO
MGLVDYAGSDSDSDQEAVISNKNPVVPSNPKVVNDDSFFDHPVTNCLSTSHKPDDEDVLEEIVKPKNWEIKLAEKAKKKLEKKALKKAQKQQKKEEKNAAKQAKKAGKILKIGSGVQKDKGKTVISAFGALGGIMKDNSSDDSDDDEKLPASTKEKLGHGLLLNLPAPKGRDNRSDGTHTFTNSMVPHSVAKKAGTAPHPSSTVFKPLLAPVVADESDDDEDGPIDFFGFSSTPQRKEEVQSEIPFMAMNSSMDVVGPSRPTESDDMDPSQMYQLPEEDQQHNQEGPSASDAWLHRKITDEQAHKLLMRFSHDIRSEERRSINEMANSIVDVNVDDALGPDVKTNIIKNLGHRAFVEATSAPIPQVQTQGQTSRRKHQITYLASLAVAREEQLKDQWAEQKQSKRMARQKYGF